MNPGATRSPVEGGWQECRPGAETPNDAVAAFLGGIALPDSPVFCHVSLQSIVRLTGVPTDPTQQIRQVDLVVLASGEVSSSPLDQLPRTASGIPSDVLAEFALLTRSDGAIQTIERIACWPHAWRWLSD